MGKTKDVRFEGDDVVIFTFKDDATGANGRFDPGANQVIGQIPGKGEADLRTTAYFFNLLSRHSIPSHFIGADYPRREMRARRATLFFENGLEFICRRYSYGSFCRRYGVEKMLPLDYLIEITTKDDEGGDPLINDDAIIALGIMSERGLDRCKELVARATKIIADDLASKRMNLIDIKFELGLVPGFGHYPPPEGYSKEILIIDEISSSSMRVSYEGGILPPRELATEILD